MFYELLQIAIGNRDRFSQTPTVGEWRELFALAQKQALVGIAFRGVEQLPEEQRPPKALLMQWYMATERIKKMNADLDRKALAVAEKFRSEGFPGVVLKGQGIAKLYRWPHPNPLTGRGDSGIAENSKHYTLHSKQEDSHTDCTDYTEDSCLRDVALNLTQNTQNSQNTHCCARVGHPDGDDAAEQRLIATASQVKGERLKVNGQQPTANSQQPTANLSAYRTPGDIDIWLHGERKDILNYVRRHVPDCKPVYHHVDFPVVDGLDIEVHFTPSWMNSPVTNRRLQRFFATESLVNAHCAVNVASLRLIAAEQQVDGGGQRLIANSQQPTTNSQSFPVPSLAFNRVYILVHIYRHLFAEGIGLRQLLDYYFVLCQGFTEEEREETMRVLRSLKMVRFARAVMWVLQEVYGMDDRYLLTSPDEREGCFLLSEIMLAGNFGQYDERLQHEKGESALHWGWRKVKRNFRFVRSYPSEVLWSPIFKLWHYFWRKGL